MKGKFLLGMFSGVLMSLMLFGLIACGSSDENKLSVREQYGTDAGGEILEDLNERKYTDKIANLLALLDYYYIDELDADAIEEGIYAGLVNSLGDIYTTYYTAEEFVEFNESSTGSYAGLGSTVTQDANGNITFVKPFVNGPAHKAGILPGDILVEIDGESTVDMDLTEAVSKIKGEPGTTVDIKIYRAGESDYLSMTVERAFVEVPTVEYQMLDNKIGYIYVMEFDEVTEQQFIDAVDDLEAQGMQGMIVDLRDNPGGLLSTVCGMLSRIVPKGDMLVYMEDKYGRTEEYKSDSAETVDVPITVLINENSASASEVFAGALQDYGIATLVGTQSFGKGIVQSIVPLQDGSAIKVTVSRYFTPNGVCIHGVGLTPDLEVELDEELKGQLTIPIEDDNQIQAAVEYLLDH
ncbi:MAG: S41 family peptidase [Lachnospiraceae bacterium]|nr:S41 family peptidase [Lachnospiraceae bacterium]